MERLPAPRLSADWLFIMPPIMPDMFRSDMEEELDKSGQVCELFILGQESELTILKMFLLKPSIVAFCTGD